jgi:tetratricopeptide (TPR) repeat protein
LVFSLLLTPLSLSAADDNSPAAVALKAEETLFMAKKAFEDGFYEVSLGLLKRFLNNYPGSSSATEANLLIGECYFHQNKFSDALTKFEELLKNPAAKSIKDALYYWIAEVNFKGNNFKEAVIYYKNIIREFPTSSYVPIAYYSLGWCLFQEQKFKAALEYFRILAQKYPKEPQSKDAMFKIIECLYNLKDYPVLKSRINQYIAVLSKDPLRASYMYLYLGEADYYLGNFVQAIDAYSKVLGVNPDEKMQALAKLDMAWSYLKLKRYKEAEDIFSGLKADYLEKRNRDVLSLGKAMLLMETNRVNEAKKIYEQLAGTAYDPLISAQARIGRADALYNLADYPEASKAYKYALAKINPKETPLQSVDKLRYNLGWSLLKQGDIEGAIKEFREVAGSADDANLKLSALCQIGDAYQESSDFKNAEETYNLLLKEYPDSSYADYALYQLGSAFLKDSKNNEAISNFSKLIKDFPASKFLDDATYSLGLVYFKLQDYDSAKVSLKKFQLELKDSDLKSKAFYLLGSCLYNSGDYAQAIEIFKEIPRLSNYDDELAQKTEYSIADSLFQSGKEEEALARFKALRSKYPDSILAPEIIWWLGSYYYKHNEPDLASRYFLSLIRDFPKSYLLADAYYALGLTINDESRAEEALDNFKKAFDLNNPEIKPKAALGMADIYAKEEKFDLALSLYKDAAVNYPDLSALIYPKMAEAFFKTGDYDNALNYYYKSLAGAASADAGVTRIKLAEIREAIGEPDAAIKEYLEAAKLSGQDNALAAKAYFRIGQIYEDRNNPQEALNAYKKISDMNIPESKYARERISRVKFIP